MSDSVFACPICQSPLIREVHSYRCRKDHCFDISREGYVNLLPANRRHSDMPGDDREMVKARTRFLEGGWYAPLREELCRLVDDCTENGAVVLDAGCGEGYYTEAIDDVVRKKNGVTAGIDLSKTAVKKAARRCPEAEIAVASVYHMPLADGIADVLVNCFAPLADKEFSRVLKPGGSFIYVVPGQRHLWEMKEILYDQPYENTEKEESYAGFTKADEVRLEYTFRLRNQEEISSLFQMTPYNWKTPGSGKERLLKYHELPVSAQFRILVYKRVIY